jgi:cytochrome oxidase Cu insertion factor (SCO1/SenC/PrrC family)
MDAEVKSTNPGQCPKCGMALRVYEAARPTDRPRSRDGRPEIRDIDVLDQDGRKLRFYSDLVHGKTVAINFLFTTCTTICPPLAATFRKVQISLGDRAGRDVRLISVSVDPAIDTPARLKEFGAKFNAGPGWTFITGRPSDIEQLLQGLGAATTNKFAHTPTVLIGNDTAAFWTRAYGLGEAGKLTDAIASAAGKSASLQK